MSDKKYYVSSFFWSTFSRLLSAGINFVSVPLLLGVYGKADYGLIAIATACNSYMQLLDLGMNNGAIKFYSQWKAEGRQSLIYSVARTNITFYIIIAVVNALGLLSLAFWGESLFSVTHEQFATLRSCLIIIAVFSLLSWGTTSFNQLLIADKQMAYTMKLQSVASVLKGVLVAWVVFFDVSIEVYFFFFTAIYASLLLPYMYKCKCDKLIDSFKPASDWKSFKVVLTFSLSLFLLSVFQMTSTQSRPIILSIFASNGAEVVTEFRIIEVVPQLIIMIGGVFSGIFLPKTAAMVTRGDRREIESFAYGWTRLTSIIACLLCFPFILCSKEVLEAYVGKDYVHLSVWMIIWCVTVLIQIHTTPCNSLVLAYGKTRPLVITSAISCLISMAINITLCQRYGVGAAIIGYFVYVIIVIGLYYVSYYKSLIKLNRIKIAMSFIFPTFLAIMSLLIVVAIPDKFFESYVLNERMSLIVECLIKTVAWLVPYVIFLFATKTVTTKMIWRW